MKKTKIALFAAGILVAVCLAGVLGKNAQRSVGEQKIDGIRKNVLSAAVQCYAVEGVFPPDLQYLEDNYGLVVDKDTYIVTYEAFSTNMMPDVSVLVRGEG